MKKNNFILHLFRSQTISNKGYGIYVGLIVRCVIKQIKVRISSYFVRIQILLPYNIYCQKRFGTGF